MFGLISSGSCNESLVAYSVPSPQLIRHINGIVQDCSDYIADELEIPQS